MYNCFFYSMCIYMHTYKTLWAGRASWKAAQLERHAIVVSVNTNIKFNFQFVDYRNHDTTQTLLVFWSHLPPFDVHHSSSLESQSIIWMSMGESHPSLRISVHQALGGGAGISSLMIPIYYVICSRLMVWIMFVVVVVLSSWWCAVMEEMVWRSCIASIFNDFVVPLRTSRL